jgi:hypothetical protein
MRQSTKDANADHLVTAIPDHLAHANLDLHFRDQRLKGSGLDQALGRGHIQAVLTIDRYRNR